jgi:hypothetical protein
VACRPNPVCCPLAQELRVIFTFLNTWGKKTKGRKIFHITRKVYDIQVSVSIIKVFWNTITLICLCSSVAAVMLKKKKKAG